MAESIWQFAPFILAPLIWLAAWWVWQDAQRLRKRGANLTPGLWGVLALVAWVVVLPAYLILRRTAWRREIDPSLPPSRLQILQRHRFFYPILDIVLALCWLYLALALSGESRIPILLVFVLQVFAGIMGWRRALSESAPRGWAEAAGAARQAPEGMIFIEVNTMKRLLLLAVLCGIAAVPAGAEPPAGDDPWLSRLVGQWVLEGQIAGKDTIHDVDAEWVLNHLYVRLHEVSREKDSKGQAAYEAIVYVTWYAEAGEYAILWLDSTASGGFSPEGVGHAKPEGESLPFVFKDAHGEVSFKNTFVYDPESGTWAWGMDNVDKGVPKPFGRVKLRRR